MKSQDRDLIAYFVSGGAGLLVGLALLAASGKKEIWDNAWYFPVGIPVMCLVIFGISYYVPKNAWRWTVTMALGQTASMFLAGGSMSLWPLSIVVMMVMSAPQFLTGFLASRFSIKRNSQA